jgi:hypothetical protein
MSPNTTPIAPRISAAAPGPTDGRAAAVGLIEPAMSQPEGCTKIDRSGHITHVAGRRQHDANHQNDAGRPP